MAQTPRTRDKRLVGDSSLLAEMDVLVLDCQSTGASPAHGHLLELAWSVYRAEQDAPKHVTAHVISLPEPEELPRRIQRMTGIEDDELADASHLENVWRALQSDAADLGDGPDTISVIHYARFETSFLRDAHARLSGDDAFPLDIICTHRIAQRLFPELPRRGLRALAGFLGHTVPEKKRAGHHVEATAAIWRHTVRELDVEYGVTTLGELYDWLEAREPTRRGGKGYALPRETRLSLPETPGVYRMLSKSGDVLYVGKATSLKSRVNSYFQTRRGLSNTKLELVTQVWDVDVSECATPLEAALLETDEIKYHSPTYNTALRRQDRTLCYADRAWSSFREQPDHEHVIGPLRDSSSLKLLGLLRHGRVDEVPLDALEHLGESHEMLADGVAVLHENFGVDLSDPDPPLRRFALERWRERYEEKLAEREADDTEELLDESDGEDGDDLEGGDDGGEREWTPELVAERLERTLRWAYRDIRFGRWMNLLRDSEIRWTGRNGRDHRVCMVAGAVVEGPVAPERTNRHERRAEPMDLATWDRLRVLTTELRRLTGTDAAPSVALHGLGTLGPDDLARLFRWI